jgi:hypothetical protein
MTEKPRGYADFFDWPEKRLKENGVVQSFAEMRSILGLPPLVNIESREDPPDCQAFDVDGRLIGIEVSELIDKEFLSSLKKGKRKDWAATWDYQKLIDLVAERIDRKGRAKPKGGPYASYLLVIFTDEPNLNLQWCQSALVNYRFARPGVIDEAYLLMSYAPSLGGCPFIQLRLTT